MKSEEMEIKTILREALADALIRQGHGNRQFIADLRAGKMDNSPYIFGAAVGWIAATEYANKVMDRAIAQRGRIIPAPPSAEYEGGSGE